MKCAVLEELVFVMKCRAGIHFERTVRAAWRAGSPLNPYELVCEFYSCKLTPDAIYFHMILIITKEQIYLSFYLLYQISSRSKRYIQFVNIGGIAF